MSKSQGRMEFGLFMPPQHYPRQNPTRAIHRDLETIVYAESLGFTEAWVGEHHTGGSELIGPSDLFLAAAVERTSRIRLGTGVASLPYHHPFDVAERAVFLDHLSYGRTMFGVGPGSLPSDGHQIGLDWSTTRARMVESLESIYELMTTEGTVSRKSDWFTLKDAALQVGPYTPGDPKFVFTAMESPFGPSLAGKYGGGLLSLSATTAAGYAALGRHWGVVEEQAEKHGRTVDRSDWRVVVMMHIAETREEAYRQCTPGLLRWATTVQGGSERTLEWFAPDPDAPPPTGPPTTEELAGFLAGTKVAAIGTPEDAIEVIQALVEATGGFGKLLIYAGWEVADQVNTYRSLELFAREVLPHFNGSSQHMIRSEARVQATLEERRAEQRTSIQAASSKYVAENK
jgi:limonene 1,2-monooxygenase